jgi:hypothetical protein
MTDIIITTPISLRRPHLLRVEFPKLEIGSKVEAISKAIMQAFEMAYVVPFSTPQSKLAVAVDDADLEGRDPNW